MLSSIFWIVALLVGWMILWLPRSICQQARETRERNARLREAGYKF